MTLDRDEPADSETRIGSHAATRAEAADAVLAAQGDARAFERLYRAHVARVHSLARRMLTPAEADDATQDVFVRAWQKLGTFRGASAFGTWLHRLAVNLLLARRQTLGARRARHEDDDVVLERIAASNPAPHLRMDFEQALAQLPDRARQVLILHDVEGYRHEEIGELLRISPGTSKSQLHRARMAMRALLEA